MKLLSVVCASATKLSGSAGETDCVAHPASVAAAKTRNALRREGLSIIKAVIILFPLESRVGKKSAVALDYCPLLADSGHRRTSAFDPRLTAPTCPTES